MERTSKCNPIADEMTWREVLAESAKIDGDNDAVISLGPGERILIGSAMFAKFRHNIIESLPKDIAEKELKKRVYFRTYGEPLPDDFFKD